MPEDSASLENEKAQFASQMELFPMLENDLEVLSSGEFVVVFFRGLCVANFLNSDRFARNYCLVQLHISGGIKLKKLSKLFGISYQQSSRILVQYKNNGQKAYAIGSLIKVK